MDDTANSLNRHEALTYLLAESRCLAEQGNTLRRELDTLPRAPRFSMKACVAYSDKLRAYRGLLANHAIALKWTVPTADRQKAH